MQLLTVSASIHLLTLLSTLTSALPTTPAREHRLVEREDPYLVVDVDGDNGDGHDPPKADVVTHHVTKTTTELLKDETTVTETVISTHSESPATVTHIYTHIPSSHEIVSATSHPSPATSKPYPPASSSSHSSAIDSATPATTPAVHQPASSSTLHHMSPYEAVENVDPLSATETHTSAYEKVPQEPAPSTYIAHPSATYQFCNGTETSTQMPAGVLAARSWPTGTGA